MHMADTLYDWLSKRDAFIALLPTFECMSSSGLITTKLSNYEMD